LPDIVAGHMQLKKAGRVFKGLCCFHQEKTPSFTVDPEKELYYCHGCGEGGDVFSFLQKTEGLNFAESAQRLADRLGMHLKLEGGSEKSEGSRSVLLAAHEAAAAYFSEILASGSEAAPARKYLEARGFTSEDAMAWRLGFGPGGVDTLYRRLLEMKFTPKQIVDAGLALVTEAGEHRDRFRRRVIVPVSEVTGKVVGFGARALGDEQPKYLNSPETPIYHKARILFGLDRAKTEMVRMGAAIVTEGYTDVIALHKIGFTNAVATCGTALGEDHFSLIKRFCDRAVLAFDADAAGAVASERGFGIHSKIGLEVLVAPIPAGKDPADVALAQGSDAFRLIIDSAKPLLRFVLEQEMNRHGFDTPEGKAKAVRAAAGILAWEPNRVARSEHGFWVAGRIGVSPEQVQLEIAEMASAGASLPPLAKAIRRPGHVKAEREALAILMSAPYELGHAKRPLTQDHFAQASHRVLFAALIDAAGNAQPEAVMDRLPDDDSRRLAAELALSPLVTVDPQEVFMRLEVFRIERKIEATKARLASLNPTDDAVQYDSIFEELMRLDSERRGFDEQ